MQFGEGNDVGRVDVRKMFRKIFVNTNTFLEWMASPGLIGLPKSFNILLFIIILGGAIIKYSGNLFVNRVVGSIFSVDILLTTYIGFFKFDKVLLSKILTGETRTPAEILSSFSNPSFIFGITYFSYFTSVFLFMMIYYLLGIKLPDLVFPNLILSTSALFTVFWFMYHLLFNSSVTIKYIKVRLRLYLAISGTFSAFVLPFTQTLIKPVITYLGLAFVWLSYFIERVEFEQETGKDNSIDL